MRYFVAIPIPQPHLSMLTDVKQRFLPPTWHDTIDPHITLLAPDLPLLSFEEAAKAFHTAALTSSGFTIQASRLDRFVRHGRHTLVLRPEPQDWILDLFNELLKVTSWQRTNASTKREYVSHITLANQLTEKSADLAEAELSNQNLSVQFSCNTLTLYAKQPSWTRWQELASKTLPH
jgi:2'-5' RNA ligase